MWQTGVRITMPNCFIVQFGHYLHNPWKWGVYRWKRQTMTDSWVLVWCKSRIQIAKGVMGGYRGGSMFSSMLRGKVQITTITSSKLQKLFNLVTKLHKQPVLASNGVIIGIIPQECLCEAVSIAYFLVVCFTVISKTYIPHKCDITCGVYTKWVS